MFRYCINVRKSLVNIQFKESFRPMFLYMNRLEGQVHVQRHKTTSIVIFFIYIYIVVGVWQASAYKHTMDIQCKHETSNAQIVS